MLLGIRDPFSGDGDDAEGGSLITFARILAFLFAAILCWILYRVITGAWRQYQQNGPRSLFDRRRGTYRRIPSLRLQRPEEDAGYRDGDLEVDMDDEPDADDVIDARGKTKTMDLEVVDEGYHDSETSLDMQRGRRSPSPSRSADVWKQLPERPLPDKPLPDVPRG